MMLGSGSSDTRRIFENICVTYPKNSCDSRGPLGLPRPRGGSTPAPHSSPLRRRRKNGLRGPPRRAGAVGRLSRGRIARSPGWRRIVKMEIPALYLTGTNACAAVHPCTTQEQTLYQRMCCCMIRVLLYTSTTAVYVLGERGAWRGEAKTTIPAPRWHGSEYYLLPVTLVFFIFYFLSAIPSPASGIVPRLFCWT